LRSDMQVVYLGAGKYKFTFVDKEIKAAEKNISSIERILGKFQDKISNFTFSREKADFDA
jgi:translation initiation factor 2 alpha subunit (eIF-2alpha)